MRKPLKSVSKGDVVWILPKNTADSIQISCGGISLSQPLKVSQVRTVENSTVVELEGIDRLFRIGRLTNIPP